MAVPFPNTISLLWDSNRRLAFGLMMSSPAAFLKPTTLQPVFCRILRFDRVCCYFLGSASMDTSSRLGLSSSNQLNSSKNRIRSGTISRLAIWSPPILSGIMIWLAPARLSLERLLISNPAHCFRSSHHQIHPQWIDFTNLFSRLLPHSQWTGFDGLLLLLEFIFPDGVGGWTVVGIDAKSVPLAPQFA